MKKLPGEMTTEELEVSAKISYENWKTDVANKKKQIEPLFPRTPEDHAACAKLKKKLHNPIPLTSDYERSITKSAEAKERRVGKEIAQLGLQKEQSIEPLKVYTWPQQHQVDAYDPNKDPEFIRQYGEKAHAVGVSITEYMSRLEEFETGNDEEFVPAYHYRHGCPLVRPELVKDLPTKMRKLHDWYMEKSANSENWIYAKFQNEHYGHGQGFDLIEFSELFQFYNGDAIDKSIVSAYCL